MNTNNKNFCVYEHVFPNGKRYIGITSKKPTKRWENGKGYDKNHQPVMYNAIHKYGWDNIEHNILFENLSEKEAKEKEKELIQFYHTFIYDPECMGYNMTLGGEGTIGHKSTEKIKQVNRQRLLGKKGKDCVNSRPVMCDNIEYESLTQFCEINHLSRAMVITWVNGRDTMPMEWYNKQLHYKDSDFSIIKPRENEKCWKILIDDKCFYSQRDFADYIHEEYPTVCLWLNRQNPMPMDLLNHGLKVFINDEEIVFTKTKKRIVGWEYKGHTFNNLRELSEYLNIEKGTLWKYLKHPNSKSSQKYLPLKDIHKIEF